jgi:hypothetical protein
MLKSAILLFNAIALLIYQFFFAGDITVTQTAPAAAKPESEFTVELTIKKGSTTGFAKLQQELPEGFTAVQDKSNGASFTFNNQAVKFIWMSLPNEAEFKVSYKVKVAAGINGDQSIGGKFSYVTDNTKQTADIAPVTVTVEGDGNAVATTKSTTPTTDNTANATDNTATADNTATSDNTTTDNTSTTDNTTANNTTTNTDNGSFRCVRTVPSDAPTEFVVELDVNKGNLGGFAKLVETLPAGFTASAIENAGGSFSFADSKVRFIWVSLPTQPEFKISYKVKAPKNAGQQSITGIFSYIEDDNTRKYDVQASNFSVGSTVGNVASTNTTTTTDPNTLTFSNNTSTTNTTNNNLSANTIPTPQVGVIYRVQIMALQNNRTAAYVANYYNMSSSNVQKLAEDGLNKYVLKDTHAEYKSARDARENVKSRGVVAPFVAAYNSGRRITVQDALMTTSQKWYR